MGLQEATDNWQRRYRQCVLLWHAPLRVCSAKRFILDSVLVNLYTLSDECPVDIIPSLSSF